MQPISFVFAVFEFVLLLFSLSVQECAHAWMASRLGDQTARLEGRVTLNPAYHIDPFGSLLFPALIIFGPLIGFNFFGGLIVGWGKPVDIMTRNFRRITRDYSLAVVAGPLANLLLATIGFIMLVVIARVAPDGAKLAFYSLYGALRGGVLTISAASEIQALAILAGILVLINLSLFIFNLLPIPPLDGSRLLRNHLPYNMVQAYDRIPIWISYVLMFFVGGTVIMAFLRPTMSLLLRALIPH